MKPSNRYSLPLIVCAFVAASVSVVLVVSRNYEQALAQTASVLQARVESNSVLQLALLRGDRDRLRIFLDSVTQQPPLIEAGVYGSEGKALAHRRQDGTPGANALDLSLLRADSAITETSITTLTSDPASARGQLARSVFGSGPLHITVPISSSAMAGNGKSADVDLFRALYADSGESSRLVTGYLHAVADRDALRAPAVSAGLALTAVYLLVFLFWGMAVWFYRRSMRSPLVRLQALASDLSAGKPVTELHLDEDRELGDVAFALKTIIRKARDAQHEADVERKLLGRKVDERSSRLSVQDSRLGEAEVEINAARDELHRIAHFDGLTGLPNRTHLLQELQTQLRSGESLALLFLNLHEFGRINDSFGYAAGDLVLREVGKRLVQCLEQNSAVSTLTDAELPVRVARVGGDEFAIVLNRIDSAEAAGRAAQSIIQSLLAPVLTDRQEIVVSPCIGIAMAPDNASEIDGLVRAAGLAMNSVTPGPEGAFLYYSEDLEAGKLDHFHLESELRRALEKQQFSLHYQPQIDAVDGAITCAEVLLRWDHPELGPIPPSRFIPIARQTGIIRQLGHWAIEEACAQLRSFRDNELELPRLAVNVAAEELGNELVAHVRAVLEANKLEPDSLELGLSEIALLDAQSEGARCLQELGRLGVQLSLDNFGTSTMPLSHLNHCPLNALRIDRSIVHQCHANPGNAALVKTIIAIADTLNLRIVAEGVESAEEFAFLTSVQSRAVQGYLFSAPLPAAELEHLLEVPWPFMTLIQSIHMAAPEADD